MMRYRKLISVAMALMFFAVGFFAGIYVGKVKDVQIGRASCRERV